MLESSGELQDLGVQLIQQSQQVLSPSTCPGSQIQRLQLPASFRSRFIEPLEALHIFGIRTDYMRQFKEYLEEEGLPVPEEREELLLPVVKFPSLDQLKLKIIRLKEDVDFKKAQLSLLVASHPIGAYR